jgi:hypothetical protein
VPATEVEVRTPFKSTEHTQHGLIDEEEEEEKEEKGDDDDMKTRVALNSEPAMDGTEKSASRPGRITPGERTPYWIRVLMTPGRAVAQAVSHWLPTAAARIACGVCGGQSGTGTGFLRVLRFPLSIIPPISPSS